MAVKKKFDWSQFTLRIEIEASPEKVFKAWTEDKTVSKWFTTNTIIDPRKNGRVFYEWLDGTQMDTKVLRIIKNRFFSFPFGNKGEKVDVRIKKVSGGSLCELSQLNMKTTENDKIWMHMGCREGWTFFLTNLKAFLEHGVDLRNKNRKNIGKGYINN